MGIVNTFQYYSYFILNLAGVQLVGLTFCEVYSKCIILPTDVKITFYTAALCGFLIGMSQAALIRFVFSL